MPIAEKLAEHFNSISNEFDGLGREHVPDAVPNSPSMLTPNEVVKRLREFKKPKVNGPGGHFPGCG